MNHPILGGLSTRQFLREYWQKKPLLIRNALPDFSGLLTKTELIHLAGLDEAQSRLVHHYRGKWMLTHGPFKPRDVAKLAGNWALLVENVNHFLSSAEALLKKFNFIPHARLDDLMISLAPNASGVGPHVDSYDVFLLQGTGKRLWQIAEQFDKTLLPNTPLKILKNFQAEQEWLLEPGDMLYLPPHYAHNGIAVGECMTYSIGFRAPHYEELLHEFLLYLQDHLSMDGMYTDPELTPSQNPAQIPPAMIKKVATQLNTLRFNNHHITHFLGQYLSEPKAHIFFEPPESPLTKAKFLSQARRYGIRLDLKSQLLFTSKMLFMNGETYPFATGIPALLQQLANQREVVFNTIDKATGDLLYQWYCNGYLAILSIRRCSA